MNTYIICSQLNYIQIGTGYILVSDKSTGQTVVNGAASNVIYSYVSKAAGYDLYIIIKKI